MSQVHDDLEAYVLGALESGESQVFEAHCRDCSPCRDGFASYANVLRAFRTLPVNAPPRVPRVGAMFFRRLPAVAAIAASLLLAGGIAWTSHVGSDGDLTAVVQMITDRPLQIALNGATAHGTALLGSGGRRTAFVVDGLPPPPAGRGYQVWVRRETVRSPGMLHRTSGGLEVLVVPGNILAGTHHIGVTMEPAGGSAARTGPPQVSSDDS